MASSRCPQIATRQSWQLMKRQSMGLCRQTSVVERMGQASASGARRERKTVNLEPLKLIRTSCWPPLGTLKSTLPCWYFKLACRVSSLPLLAMSTSSTLFLVCELSINQPSQYLFSWILSTRFPLGTLKNLGSFSLSPSTMMYLSLVCTSITVLLSISLMKCETVLSFSSFSSLFMSSSSGACTEGSSKETLSTSWPTSINFISRSSQTSQSWMWLHSVARASTPCSLGWHTAFFILNLFENFQYSFSWWLPSSNGVKERTAESFSRAKTLRGSLSGQKKDWTAAVRNLRVQINLTFPCGAICHTERL